MKTIKILLAIAAGLFLGAGIYYKFNTDAETLMILNFANGFGMTESMPVWKSVLMWCAINHNVCICLGVIGAILYFIVKNVEKKRNNAIAFEENITIGTWRCAKCGEVNKNSRATCAKCGALESESSDH